MSKPLTADQLLTAFNLWGVKYREHPGWRNHNREGHGAWGPVHGLVLHHTGDDLPDHVDVKTLWNGRSDLPGPLCTWGMRDDGVAVLIGNGRANHAGGGDPQVLNEVVNESYGRYPSKSHFHDGSPGQADGNSVFYGQETMYSGGHPMSLKAYQNTVLAFAAVCHAHGWSAKSCIGHKEWSDWKPDPGNLDMAKFRADVQAALDAGPRLAKHNAPGTRKRLTPAITKMREELKSFNLHRRRPAIRKAGMAFDKQLAKFERR